MTACHTCLCLSYKRMEDVLTVHLLYVHHLRTAVRQITKEAEMKPVNHLVH